MSEAEGGRGEIVDQRKAEDLVMNVTFNNV